MNRLFKIESLKIRANASFWVLTSLHIGILLLIILSGEFFLKSFTINGSSISKPGNNASFPIYQFPDIWHNITYIAAFLKIIPAIYVIISITSEVTYNTLRQNIMNGLSRFDFIISKLFLVFLLSFGSTVLLFLTGLILGLTNTSEVQFHDIIKYSGFIPAYFLLLTTYLLFALFAGLLVKRTGLAIGLIFLYTMIVEPVVLLRINDIWIKGLFPIRSINNLIHMPFGKYALREIQDFVAFKDIVIVLIYSALYIWFIYLLLKKRDL